MLVRIQQKRYAVGKGVLQVLFTCFAPSRSSSSHVDDRRRYFMTGVRIQWHAGQKCNHDAASFLPLDSGPGLRACPDEAGFLGRPHRGLGRWY